jgi:hypothetical protein
MHRNKHDRMLREYEAISALILRSALFARVSKDGPRASWFETALKKRLLTMRV